MHIPVLQKEVIEYLDPKPNENFIDCTLGEAGHTLALLEKNKPDGKVLGIEIDPQLYEILKASEIKNLPRTEPKVLVRGQKSPKQSLRDATGQAKIKNRLILVNDSYTNLKEIVKKYKFEPISGILFDLGMSSWHLEKSGRGFSFLRNELLDMRYHNNTFFHGREKMCNGLTAEEIVNNWPKEEIEKILREYGEEKFDQRIAKKIIETRRIKPIKTTFQLVEMIRRATPSWYHHQKINFATRTFQALRIAVNDELNNLKMALPQALEILKPEGRLAVISFHSLEDRIVKNFFKENKPRLKILTKKPIFPSNEEIKVNPCSRSAKLRVAAKDSGILIF